MLALWLLVGVALACEPPSAVALVAALGIDDDGARARRFDVLAQDLVCAGRVVSQEFAADLRFHASSAYLQSGFVARAAERSKAGHVLTGGAYVTPNISLPPAPERLPAARITVHERLLVDGLLRTPGEAWDAPIGDHFVQGLEASPGDGRWVALTEAGLELGEPPVIDKAGPEVRPPLLVAGGLTAAAGMAAVIAGRFQAHNQAHLPASDRPMVEPLLYGGAVLTAGGGGLIVAGLPF